MKEEDFKYLNFWSKLHKYIARTGMTAMFDEAQQSVEEHEYIYDKLRETLNPQEEDDLVLYVASCEAYCSAYALAAYEMGREEGPRKPNETIRDWVDDPETWESLLKCFDKDGNLTPEVQAEMDSILITPKMEKAWEEFMRKSAQPPME